MIRDRITWGDRNPLSDPRLQNLPHFVREIRLFRRLPRGVVGGAIFHNHGHPLPAKPPGHYHEYDLTVAAGNRGTLRLVLGACGEVFITGDHYDKFRQILEMPT